MTTFSSDTPHSATTKESVHISEIRIGDLVEINGVVKTVGRNNLKYDPFMGLSLFGDTYHLGTRPVTRCRYERAIPAMSKTP